MCLGGCHTKAAKTEQNEKTVKTTTVHSLGYINRDFAGMSTADDATMLAFKISGQVESVDVSKGDYVSKDQILARLDPRDVELQVDSDKSKYEQAKSQYERMKRLLDHDAVSQQEVEVARTNFVQAQSSYENSRDLLNDTQLKAPFAGVIERTYVDAYERVSSGQTILRLVNPISTKVEFTISEQSLWVLADSATRYTVRFDNYPDVSFKARLDKYAKTASDASGFPVSLRLSKEEIEGYNISPGMTCQVTLRTAEDEKQDVAIPLTAVFAPQQGGEYVWRVDKDDRVERCSVVLGSLVGKDMVSVKSGLRAGDVVVTAGVYQLREGEKVKILNQ